MMELLDPDAVNSFAFGLIIGYAAGRLRNRADQAVYVAKKAAQEAHDARELAKRLLEKDDDAKER